MGINKAFISGNIGQDPELKRGDRSDVLKLRVATNERVKRGDEWEDHTEWHNVVVFGKRGQALNDLLRKGMQVTVEGRLRTSSWDDRDTGKKMYMTEIIADEVTFATSGDGRDRDRNRGSRDDRDRDRGRRDDRDRDRGRRDDYRRDDRRGRAPSSRGREERDEGFR